VGLISFLRNIVGNLAQRTLVMLHPPLSVDEKGTNYKRMQIGAQIILRGIHIAHIEIKLEQVKILA